MGPNRQSIDVLLKVHASSFWDLKGGGGMVSDWGLNTLAQSPVCMVTPLLHCQTEKETLWIVIFKLYMMIMIMHHETGHALVYFFSYKYTYPSDLKKFINSQVLTLKFEISRMVCRYYGE